MIKFILIALIFSALSTHAQEIRNVAKTNIAAPFFNAVSLSFERTLNKSHSLNVTFNFLDQSAIVFTEYSGYQITPEYRFYLSKKVSPEGLYVAPYLRYSNLTFDHGFFTSTKGKYKGLGLGNALGYQWLAGKSNWLSIDAFFGMHFQAGHYQVEDDGDNDLPVIGLRGGVLLGLAFE